MDNMKEEELKTKVKEIFSSEKYMALILVNTLIALLITKKIVTGEELDKMKEATIEMMTDAWVKKYKDNPDVMSQFEASELIEKLFSL